MDNNVSFLSFSPMFSSNSGVTYQSFENNQVAGGRRGHWVVVVVGATVTAEMEVKQGAVFLFHCLNDSKFSFKNGTVEECQQLSLKGGKDAFATLIHLIWFPVKILS